MELGFKLLMMLISNLVVFESVESQLVSVRGVDTESAEQLKDLDLHQGIVGVQYCSYVLCGGEGRGGEGRGAMIL